MTILQRFKWWRHWLLLAMLVNSLICLAYAINIQILERNHCPKQYLKTKCPDRTFKCSLLHRGSVMIFPKGGGGLPYGRQQSEGSTKVRSSGRILQVTFLAPLTRRKFYAFVEQLIPRRNTGFCWGIFENLWVLLKKIWTLGFFYEESAFLESNFIATVGWLFTIGDCTHYCIQFKTLL